MANNNEIRLNVDTEQAQQTVKQAVQQTVQKSVQQSAKASAGTMSGLEKLMKRLAEKITKVFSQVDTGQFFLEAVNSCEKLEGALFTLRMNFGKLKAAIGDMAAPIMQAVIPAVNQVLAALTSLARAAGQVLGALLGVSFDKDASENMEDLAENTSSAGKAAKKALASFDEIERLSFSGGSSAKMDTPDVSTGTVDDKLSPQLQKIVDKIQSLLQPILNIDFSNAVSAFGRLKAAIEPIAADLFTGLEWAWRNILVPLAKWTAEDALPAFLQALAAVLQTLGAVIGAVKPAFTWLWESMLLPMASWTGEAILGALGWLRQRLEAIGAWITDNGGVITGFAGAWNACAAAIDGFTGRTGSVTTALAAQSAGLGGLVTALGSLKTAWGSVQEFVQSRVLTPMGDGIHSMVNGAIGALNGLISGLQKAANAMVDALNGLRFTVPDWVPGLGGKSVGFKLKSVSFPQIPYLAQGAVLPANRPFLAVVGDQRHGTNIEAPLETIQQAVAAVIGGGNAALSESVGLQREILRAILGIEIGDTTIGRAAARYNEKMTVMGGHYA